MEFLRKGFPDSVHHCPRVTVDYAYMTTYLRMMQKAGRKAPSSSCVQFSMIKHPKHPCLAVPNKQSDMFASSIRWRWTKNAKLLEWQSFNLLGLAKQIFKFYFLKCPKPDHFPSYLPHRFLRKFFHSCSQISECLFPLSLTMVEENLRFWHSHML